MFVADLFADSSFPIWDYATNYIRSTIDDYSAFHRDYINAVMEKRDAEINEKSQDEIIKTQEEVIKDQRKTIKRHE